MIHKKVRFQDKEYWLHEGALGFLLSPLDHYSESGELLANPSDISYAILESDGRLMRFGEQIGTDKDLIDVPIKEDSND
jgi:hypothetical protein